MERGRRRRRRRQWGRRCLREADGAEQVPRQLRERRSDRRHLQPRVQHGGVSEWVSASVEENRGIKRISYVFLSDKRVFRISHGHNYNINELWSALVAVRAIYSWVYYIYMQPQISVKTKLSSAEASAVIFGRSFGQNYSAEKSWSSVFTEGPVRSEGSVNSWNFCGFCGQTTKWTL